MATEFVGIELQLMGYEGVRKDLQQLDALLKSFRGRKQFNAGFSEARKQVVAYKGELEKLQRIQKELAKKGIFSEGLNNKIEETKNKLHDAQQAVREFGQASKDAGKTFMQTFNSMSSRIAHVGSAMQSLGNALTRLSSPFRRFTSGLLMGAGYKALNLFTEGLSNTFERADTMANYDRSLKALGLDAKQAFSIAGKEAKTAKENLDDAVQGLPTGLDEIMAAQKIYAGATGEMVESTKTAIAANNAVIASGMGSREQRFMQKYLVALASGAELTTTQWDSMGRIAPLVMRSVAKELGYTGDAYKQFNEEVRNGTISGEEFLKAFQKVGIEGEVSAAALVATKTWSGLSSNIRIAVTRMGQNVIETLNDVFKKSTGRDLLSHLLGIDSEGNRTGDGIRDWINNMSTAVQDWVKAHPDEIIGFFETLRNVDWTSLVRGFAEGTLAIAQFVGKLADLAAGKDLSWIGRFMTKAGIWGKGFTILGGVIKGLRHPLALIATVASRFGKTGGLLGLLVKLFGKGKDAKAAESVLGEAPTFASTAKRAFSAIQGVISAAAAVTIISGTGFVAFKSFKSMMRDFNEIIDILGEIGAKGWEDAAGAITAMATFFGSFALLGKIAGANLAGTIEMIFGTAGVGVLTTLMAGFANLDLHLLRDGAEQLEGTMDALIRSIDKMKDIGSIPEGVTTKIEDTIRAYNEIIELFNGKLNVDNHQIEGGLKGFGGTEVKTVENIKTVLDAMVDSANTINKINKIKLNTDKIGALKDEFNVALEAIGDIFSRDNLPETFYYGEGAGASTDFASTVSNINRTLGYFIGEDGLIAKLNTLAKTTNVMYNAKQAKTHITEVLNALKGAFVSLTTNNTPDYKSAATKMGNLAAAVDKMHDAFTSLKKIQKIKLSTQGKGGNFKAIANISSLISQLENTFETNRINALNSQISGFVDTVNSLLDQIEQINKTDGKITIEIHLKDKIFGKDKVIRDIKGINSSVRGAISAIQTSYYKTISVHIDLKPIVSGVDVVKDVAEDAVARVTSAKGGMIYRAKGGGIPTFKRKGTDTVPAMLTPGEYVHNKRAVDTFGIDFMRKVNSLDIRGAMNELMHRAGGMANINRGTNITHNYYNNQKVNQTINTNSPDFAAKVAGRFVGAF